MVSCSYIYIKHDLFMYLQSKHLTNPSSYVLYLNFLFVSTTIQHGSSFTTTLPSNCFINLFTNFISLHGFSTYGTPYFWQNNCTTILPMYGITSSQQIAITFISSQYETYMQLLFKFHYSESLRFDSMHIILIYLATQSITHYVFAMTPITNHTTRAGPEYNIIIIQQYIWLY